MCARDAINHGDQPSVSISRELLLMMVLLTALSRVIIFEDHRRQKDTAACYVYMCLISNPAVVVDMEDSWFVYMHVHVFDSCCLHVHVCKWKGKE
jgi:hypothetical protein